MNAGDRLLEEAASLCERIALFFGGVIVVGVLYEVWLAWEQFPPTTRIGHWGPVWADIAVAVGVGLEVIISFRGSHFQSELTRRSKIALGEANERAAKAVLETERLRGEFSWRAISTDQAAVLIEQLSKSIGPVEILIPMSDHESEMYGMQFLQVFAQAGWDVVIKGCQFDWLVFGVQVPDNMSPLGQPSRTVRGAFMLAGIPFAEVPIPTNSGLTRSRVTEPRKRFAEEAAKLYVGPKAHPLVITQTSNIATK